MSLLFLDFDGILNHHAHFARLPPERTATEVEYDDRSFDRACVERVNTPDLPQGCRGDEIQSWLNRHPGAGSIAILDDNADMGHLLPRLVLTTFAAGLTDAHVEAVVTMLGTA